MARPIVIAHHLIWTAYGWWLPNDLRGSMSHFIASDVIADLGKLHYGRKRVQPSNIELRRFFAAAAEVLTYPMLSFGPSEVSAIADSFGQVIAERRYTCYACAIMPDHIHMCIRKHKDLAEEMIAHFQESSRLRLRTLSLRSAAHPVWGGPGWKVFLDHPDEIRRTIPYIEDNPTKLLLPKQTWAFVKPYDGWPLHPGHNPRSPYARRLGRGCEAASGPESP